MCEGVGGCEGVCVCPITCFTYFPDRQRDVDHKDRLFIGQERFVNGLKRIALHCTLETVLTVIKIL